MQQATRRVSSAVADGPAGMIDDARSTWTTFVRSDNARGPLRSPSSSAFQQLRRANVAFRIYLMFLLAAEWQAFSIVSQLTGSARVIPELIQPICRSSRWSPWGDVGRWSRVTLSWTNRRIVKVRSQDLSVRVGGKRIDHRWASRSRGLMQRPAATTLAIRFFSLRNV